MSEFAVFKKPFFKLHKIAEMPLKARGVVRAEFFAKNAFFLRAPIVFGVGANMFIQPNELKF